MSSPRFELELSEYYQGEVIGEVFFSRMLERFREPSQRYKLGSLLQLETETKARLRPAAAKAGLDLVELDESRDKAMEALASVDGTEWKLAMAQLTPLVAAYVARFEEIAATAPPEHKALADSMVVHERSIETFARLEAAGETDRSIDGVVGQLVFPLPKP